MSLLGSGMPSFWEADLGMMRFTLGLSGWSANDWSSSSNFDLMAPRDDVDYQTALMVFKALSKEFVATTDKLSKTLGFEKRVITSALNIYAQEGRVLFDMSKKCYRLREVSNEPLPIEKIRFSSPKEEEAIEFLKMGAVKIKSITTNSDGIVKIKGKVFDKNRKEECELLIDGDFRLKDAKCSCWDFRQNRLYKGPGKHILALRVRWQEKYY